MYGNCGNDIIGTQGNYGNDIIGTQGNYGNDIIGTQGNYGNNIDNITFFLTHGNYGNNINSLLVVCFTSSILAHNNIVTNGLFSGKKILEMAENSVLWEFSFYSPNLLINL
jgi:hypothetical protein